MRRAALPLLALAIAFACSSEPPLGNALGELRVSPDSIEFARTFVGYSSERTLQLENTGRASLRTELHVDPPFAVEPASVQVVGGERRLVRVIFAPVADGPASGTIRLADGRTIPVSGWAEVPPECPPSDVCRSVSFDPASGTCVEKRLPDGARCGDACFDGACRQGECVGVARDCDDSNACTLDTCDPVAGCVHYDASAVCNEGEEDPCRIPSCDPELGCVFEFAPDETPCGPSNCTTSHICIAGTCQVRTTPEGGRCGSSTPCREQGVCVEGVCIQQPPRVLEPVWRRWAVAGTRLVFDGVVDALGNVYWAECTTGSCDLASVTIDGNSRFRRSLFVQDTGRVPTGSLALAGRQGELIVSTLAPSAVQAHATGDGSPVWTTDLRTAISPEIPEDMVWWLDEVAPPVVTSEAIVVAVQAWAEGGSPPTPFGGWLVGLDPQTGSTRWVRSLDGELEGLVGDEGGNVYLSVRPHGASDTSGGSLVSFGALGQERWRVPTHHQAPLLASGGFLLQASGEVRHTSDGGLHAQAPLLVPIWPQRSPLAAGRHFYGLGMPLTPCDGDLCPIWDPHLVRFDRTDGAEIWRMKVESLVAEPVLTREMAVLLATRVGSSAERWRLLEVLDDGDLSFACDLPQGRYDGATALYGGRWIAVDAQQQAVVAFDLGKRSVSPVGWALRGGNLGRTQRPR